MNKKIKVTVEVEPDQEVTIKPLGETMAEKANPAEGDAESSTTGTTSSTPQGGDVDVDVDF